MGLFDMAKKFKLDNLRSSVAGTSGLATFTKIVGDVDLNNISLDNLKSLTNSTFTQGVDWKSLPLGSMSSDLMNKIAPGALNVKELKKKLGNTSLLKGRTTELVDTQSGAMSVTNEVRINGDVEDAMRAKGISQGTNLQMANRAKAIRYESSSSKSIKSNFVGKETVA